MPISYKKSKILLNEHISENIYRMICEDTSTATAGQFYMLKLEGTTFLPRPISVCENDKDTITFLYAVLGKGTTEYSQLKPNDEISLTGPLGNGFNIAEISKNKIALVTGGIGIAPMLEVAKQLRLNFSERQIDLYAGFRNETYLLDKLSPYLNSCNISTDTGKSGHKGFITDIFQPENYDCVLCCGPEPMMKKVSEMSLAKNVKTYISMEKHMACGVGACLACTCKTNHGIKRTCIDGPVFDASTVEF